MNPSSPPRLPDDFLNDSFVEVRNVSRPSLSRVTASGYTSTDMGQQGNTRSNESKYGTLDDLYLDDFQTARQRSIRSFDSQNRSGESSNSRRHFRSQETFQPRVDDCDDLLDENQGKFPTYLDVANDFQNYTEQRKQFLSSVDGRFNSDNSQKTLDVILEKLTLLTGTPAAVGKNLERTEVRSQSPKINSPFDDKYKKMSDFTDFASFLSLKPEDSVSNINAFRPLQITKMKPKLDDISEVSNDDLDKTIIGGFKQNVQEKILELDSYKDLDPIKGLPIIFMNKRLNFLVHVHSALFKIISSDDGSYPSVDCADLLMADRKYWSTDPSTKLLEVVLDRTIDSRTGIVIANPFMIPILEPTMRLTQRIVYMAFDQLHKEFETEWFNVMKSVTTPKFHSKYEEMKFRRSRHHESRSSSDRKHSGSSTGSSSKSNKAGGKSKSVVGSIFGFE